jgi:hypothetical protein
MSNDEYQHLNWWKKSICMESNEKGDCLMSLNFTMLDFSKKEELFCDTINKYPKHTRDNNLNSIKDTEPYNPTPYDKTI